MHWHKNNYFPCWKSPSGTWCLTMPQSHVKNLCLMQWSPRPAMAGTHPAVEFGQDSLKMSLFLYICTEPVGDGCWPKVVTGNISQTIKIVRDHCTSPTWAPLQHRVRSSFWHWDVHCSWALWHSSAVAQFIVFLACYWQISEGGFPADFTLDNAWPTQLAMQEAAKKISLKFWCERWLCFISEKGSGAVKAEHGAQPIPILNTLGFALKLRLPPV